MGQAESATAAHKKSSTVMTSDESVTPQPKYLLVACIVLGIGAGVSYAASTGSALVDSVTQLPLIVLACALSYLINWLAWVPAECWKTEHYFDLTGSITYLTVMWASLVYGGHLRGSIPLRQWIITGMVTVWALRLGSFLLMRVKKAGKDGRFDEIKKDVFRWFNVWTIQGLWVIFTALGALTINCSASVKPLCINDYVGFGIWALGFLIEVVADGQKTAFNNNPENKGKWIDVGLWHYSRHPNYFGEIMLWTGVMVAGTAVYEQGQWVSVIIPLFVTFLLTKVSGVPMLENRADEKWGHDPLYQQYKAETSVLLILPKFTASAGGDSEAADSVYVSIKDQA